MKSVIAITSLCAVLFGCGGVGMQAGPDRGKMFAQAFMDRKSCIDSTVRSQAPVWRDEYVLTDDGDPNTYEKMQLTEKINEEWIKYTVNAQSEMNICQAKLYNQLSQLDYRLVQFYSEWDKAHMDAAALVFSGDIKTFGELNTARHNINSRFNARQSQLLAKLDNEIIQDAARRAEEQRIAQAEYWREYNASQRAYWDSFNQSIWNSWRPVTPTTTNCMVTGSMVNCTTY